MTRSASDSLRGYGYQFQESILRILDAGDHEEITLEGIEDIDLENEQIQVKYLSSKKLIPSSIQKPASLMLKDYVTNHTDRKDTTYRIYAFFGDPSGDGAFLNKDDFYNDCAKTLIDDEGNNISEINDDICKEFKERLVVEIGESFEEKEKSAKKKLGDVLGTKEDEVELYFFPNAMNLILGLSIQKDEMDRKISKASFLQKINHKKRLYGLWKKLEQGSSSYLKDIKNSIKSDFRGNKERLIFIDTTFLSEDGTGYGEEQLLLDLVSAHTLIDQNTSTKPLTIVMDIPEEELISLKSILIDNGKEFNDGHEQIKFSADRFNQTPILNTKGPIGRKINLASYEIKLVRLPSYLQNIDEINQPHTAIYFSAEMPFYLNGSVQHHVADIDSYREINNILN